MSELRCQTCRKRKSISKFVKNAGKSGGIQLQCKECKNARERERRRQLGEAFWARRRAYKQRTRNTEESRRYRANNPGKYKARDKIQKLVRKGLLVRQPCEVCGIPNAHAHHHDYRRPLAIRWLCHQHHNEEHFGKAS